MQRRAFTRTFAITAGLVLGGGLAIAQPTLSASAARFAPHAQQAVLGLSAEGLSAQGQSGQAERFGSQGGADSKLVRAGAEQRVALVAGAEAEPPSGGAPAHSQQNSQLVPEIPVWAQGLSRLNLPVEYHQAVEQELVRLLGDSAARQRLLSGLQRSGRVSHSVLQIFREQGLPEDLLALAHAASQFDPAWASKTGESGLWQFSASEAVLHGLVVQPNYDERRDVELSTRAVARRLNELFEKYGSWEWVLAAHHAGDAVISRMPEVGEKSFWELWQDAGLLPAATREFVPTVLATGLILKNLAAFRLAAPSFDAPLHGTRFQVPAGTDLALLARAAGTSLEQIRQLNPAILSEFVPTSARDLSVLLPAGSAGRARLLLNQALAGYGADALHRQVPASFDWGRDELPPGISEPARSKPAAASALAEPADPWVLPAVVAPRSGPSAVPSAAPRGPSAQVSPTPAPVLLEETSNSNSSAAAPPVSSKDSNKSGQKSGKAQVSDWARLAAEPDYQPSKSE